MSHIFGTNIDLNNNEATRFRIENTLSLPSLGVSESGRIVLHSGLGKFYGWDGANWIDLGQSGGGGGSYTLPVATELILGGVKSDGDTITIAVDGTISANYEDPAIISVDEGNGIGFVPDGRSSLNYGNIGKSALDLSESNTASSTLGGTGELSLTLGYENTNSGYGALVIGWDNTSSSNGGFTGGSGNTSGGFNDFITGTYNTGGVQTSTSNGYKFISGIRNLSSNGLASTTSGCGHINNTHGGTIVGQCALTSGSALNSASSEMFIVGNGEFNYNAAILNVVSRSNAFEVLYSGEVTAPSLTKALIDAESTGRVLVTKEWAQDTLETDASVTGTYNIDYELADTFRLTMTGNTTFSESNLPTSGVNTKVIKLYLDGAFTPTFPTAWTVSGNYDNTVLNQIVIEYIDATTYWVTVNQS